VLGASLQRFEAIGLAWPARPQATDWVLYVSTLSVAVVAIRPLVRRHHVPAELAPDLLGRRRRIVSLRALVHVVADDLLERVRRLVHDRLARWR